MTAPGRWLCALFLTAAFCVAPPAAQASPLDIPAAVPAKFRALVRARVHTAKPRRSWESRFELETRQGYDISVVAVDDVVGVAVTKHRGSGADPGRLFELGAPVSTYIARGTVTPRRIEASFGKFGRIAVRFRPSGRIVRSPRRAHCKGPDRFANRFGVFVGRIRFSGERHYVAVRAHRVKGWVHSPLRLHCGGRRFRAPVERYARPVSDDPVFPFDILQAGWREPLASTEFLAFEIGDRTLYLALTEESLGSMAVVRYALAVGSSRSFAQNEALTSATLRPPWPFDHTGSYAAAADGARTWAGPLSVSFPGAPGVPLAGPRFWVNLDSGL
ncbi:MAG TPA: hypothetical protein VF093_00290 [Solirubrobacterales bacterium]